MTRRHRDASHDAPPSGTPHTETESEILTPIRVPCVPPSGGTGKSWHSIGSSWLGDGGLPGSVETRQIGVAPQPPQGRSPGVRLLIRDGLCSCAVVAVRSTTGPSDATYDYRRTPRRQRSVKGGSRERVAARDSRAGRAAPRAALTQLKVNLADQLAAKGVLQTIENLNTAIADDLREPGVAIDGDEQRPTMQTTRLSMGGDSRIN